MASTYPWSDATRVVNVPPIKWLGESPWPALLALAALTGVAAFVASGSDVTGVPWVPFAVQSAGFVAAGALFPRRLAWLAAGLIFLPTIVVGVFGVELKASDEGVPLELMALLAAPIFAIDRTPSIGPPTMRVPG